MIKIRITGLAENVRRFKNSSQKIQDEITGILEGVAEDVRADILSKTPIKDGTAYNAVDIRVDFGTDLITRMEVYADLEEAPHWEFIENGASPHFIESIGGALRFEGRDGTEIFTKAVNHPGSPAQFIFSDAAELWADKIIPYRDMMLERIKELFE